MKGALIVVAAILLGSLLCGCLGDPGGASPAPAVTPSGGAQGTAPVTPTPTPLFPPLTDVPVDRSPNWAGYAVQTSLDSPDSGVVESVEASWNVPAVDCASSDGGSASAFWVGIDGISSTSVEQIGTESDCSGGVPDYYAWYEVYPEDSVTLDIEISPGDEVRARVEYLGNNTFRYTLRDVSTSKEVSVTDRSRIPAERSSAEWVVEAPTFHRRILPLAPFDPVGFTSATVTMNGKSGAISSGDWEYEPIVMESRGGLDKAVPSGLTPDGTAFSVTWEHA
jgi:hypothetical protein